MEKKKSWIAVGAASALGLGVIAGGAVASANELRLTSSDDTSVPALTSPDGTTGGSSADLTFDISSDSIVSPAVASVPSPVSVASPLSVASPAEVSAVSPASPDSPVSVPSPVSPASPASVGDEDVDVEDVDVDDVDVDSDDDA